MIKNIIILFLFFILVNINGIQWMRGQYMYIDVDNIPTYKILKVLEIIPTIQIDMNK